MTGFASGKGSLAPHSWSWELRSVNGKGQDIRVRVPDWVTGLEASLRKDVAAATARGNITIGLRLIREDATAALCLNQAQLEGVLAAMHQIEEQAMSEGLSLAPSTAADIVALRGVMDSAQTEDDPAPLLKALQADFKPVLKAYLEMRNNEGAALNALLQEQLSTIERLTAEAMAAAKARQAESDTAFRENVKRITENSELDEARIAQELAMLAVKADITEEIDRLGTHAQAARELLETGGPVGRKLDFLSQEFNREANTLCSKSQNAALTRIGLDLKATIDQMREQIQNVE
ncbi:YicC family protein [Lentibacter algarum]|uniref:YicC/YloC family endoribonuclease n=1 Tax=Lentibacter algarum TaxID=576131 RepID=UPI001C07044A|nr:YicC/YloC family endoribonuclease [Lentibacter algarum]MBU2982349.1 YicC family protein [Lentibacter algarum]